MAEFRRFFADKSCFDNEFGIIEGNEFNHIKKVLRLRAGDEIIVCFNDGVDNLCEIVEICDKNVKVKIKQSFLNKAENICEVTLFQACMKGDKMDFCVQKAVELGVNVIVPFENKFTVAKLDGKKTERFSRIAFEASKQCGRAKLTQIFDCVSFKKMLEMLKLFDTVIFCNEHEKQNGFLSELYKLDFKGKIAVVIGSEGGFAKEEAEEIKSLTNVLSVSFGNRILRAETAGVFALSVLDSVMAEKNK